MNYIAFGGRFYLRFAYVDTHNYTADSLFNRRNVPVKYEDEYAREGSKYRIIFCRIPRKHRAKFMEALGELPNKMLLCGHRDYEEFCEDILGGIKAKYGEDKAE